MHSLFPQKIVADFVTKSESVHTQGRGAHTCACMYVYSCLYVSTTVWKFELKSYNFQMLKPFWFLLYSVNVFDEIQALFTKYKRVLRKMNIYQSTVNTAHGALDKCLSHGPVVAAACGLALPAGWQHPDVWLVYWILAVPTADHSLSTPWCPQQNKNHYFTSEVLSFLNISAHILDLLWVEIKSFMLFIKLS